MPIAKRIGLVILSPLLILLLFVTAIDIGFVRTASQPGTVKRLVSSSGIYNSVVPNVLAQTKTIPTSIGDIPTTDPAIIKAANAALRPQFIQQNTEMAIDNVYQWLNGQIAQPNFTIDLSGVKTLFANNIADSLQKRLSSLPGCSLAQQLSLLESNFQAYNAICLPRGVNPAAIAEQVKQDIVNQQAFLKNTTISASSIKNSNDNQSVFRGQLVDAPRQFQAAKAVPAILITLVLLTGLGIVLLSRNKLLGLRHVGICLLLAAMLTLVLAQAVDQLTTSQLIPKIHVDNAVMQQAVRKLVADVTHQIDKNYWVAGGFYVALGAGCLAAAELIRRDLLPDRSRIKPRR